MDPSELRELREDSGDDTLRLKWARRFQDEGDPARAELVRVQCALALAPFEGPAAFLESTALPVVRSLNLGEAERSVEQLAQLLAAEGWSALAELELGDEPDLPGCVGAALAAGLPALRRLAVFGYMAATGGDDAARELAASPATRQLHTLELWNTQLGPEGARALAESSRLRGLHTLRVGGGDYSTNCVGPEGAAALASSPHLAGLRELHLASNRIGDEGAMALGRAAPLRSLEVLNLRQNELHHDGLKHVLVSELLESVQTLDLSLNSLEDRAVESLVVADPGALHTLWLRGNPLSDRGARMLAQAPLCRRLRCLHLGGTRIGDEGARALLPLAQQEHFVRLFLDPLNLGEDTCRQLREAFGGRVAL